MEELVFERPSLPKGPPLPRVVQSAAWLADPARFMSLCHFAYGDAFTVRLAGVPPIVVLSHPSAVRDVLTGDPETFHFGDANRALKPAMWLIAFGKHSLFLLDDDRHQDERKWLMAAFRPGQLHVYERTVSECVSTAIDGWTIGESFDLHQKMQDLSLDVLLQTVFGKERSGPGTRLRRAVADMLAFRDHPSTLLLLGRTAEDGLRRAADRVRWPSPWTSLERTIQDVDDEIRAEIGRQSRQKRSDTMLAALISARHEHGMSSDDQHLTDEVRTLLVAGHETTSRALAFAVFELLRSSDVLDRLREELPNGNEYLDCVIRETLRVHPVVPLLVRRLAGPARVQNRKYSVGTLLACSIQLIQRSEAHWPDPGRFRPERFLGTKMGHFEFLPFGQGRRRCLGKAFALLEMRAVLGTVAAKTRLRLSNGSLAPKRGRSPTFAAPTGLRVVREA